MPPAVSHCRQDSEVAALVVALEREWFHSADMIRQKAIRN